MTWHVIHMILIHQEICSLLYPSTKHSTDRYSRRSTINHWLNEWITVSGGDTSWFPSHLPSILTQCLLTCSLLSFWLSNYYLQNCLTPTFLSIQTYKSHWRKHAIPLHEASSAPRVKLIINFSTHLCTKPFPGGLKCQIKVLHFPFKDHMPHRKMTSHQTVYRATEHTSKGHWAILYLCLRDYAEPAKSFHYGRPNKALPLGEHQSTLQCISSQMRTG